MPSTSLIFMRYGDFADPNYRWWRQPFPRWSVSFEDRGGLMTRTFNTRWGCRRFAATLGREAVWIGK